MGGRVQTPPHRGRLRWGRRSSRRRHTRPGQWCCTTRCCPPCSCSIIFESRHHQQISLFWIISNCQTRPWSGLIIWPDLSMSGAVGYCGPGLDMFIYLPSSPQAPSGANAFWNKFQEKYNPGKNLFYLRCWPGLAAAAAIRAQQESGEIRYCIFSFYWRLQMTECDQDPGPMPATCTLSASARISAPFKAKMTN